MQQGTRVSFIGLIAVLFALAAPAPTGAQTVAGQARAVQVTVGSPLGTSSVTTLVDTGSLSSNADARQASLSTGSVPSVLGAEALHATAIAYADHVESEASMASLALNVGGTTVGADFVMSRAVATANHASGSTTIDGLSIGGVPMVLTGAKNEWIPIAGGFVVVNEWQETSTGLVVNALHIVVGNTADVVIGSAGAAFQ